MSAKTKAIQSNVALAALLLTAVSLVPIAPSYAQCAGCNQHTGQEQGLLPKDTASSATSGSSDGYDSLWGPSGAPLKTGTQSTTLQTGTQSTMLQTGTDSTTLQTGTQNTLLQSGVERKGQKVNIEILVDCSQSMKEGLAGFMSDNNEPKMEAAKRVLAQTMDQIASDVNIGLRVFGQSYHNDPFLDCQQTALLVPIGTHNRRAIVEKIRQIRSFGLTPLTYGLQQAAMDLDQCEGEKRLILISDGAETCGLDPCAMIRSLTARGINIKIDIVGIGLKHDKAAQIQLNCIAESTGGKFYDSNTSAELLDNLHKITGETQISGKVLTKLKQKDIQQIMPGNLK